MNFELLAQPLHHEPDQARRDRRHTPAVLRQKPFPAAETALVKEDAAGKSGHTLAALDHHQCPHIALEVGKAGDRKAGRKDLK
jgi:hypothetical protein